MRVTTVTMATAADVVTPAIVPPTAAPTCSARPAVQSLHVGPTTMSTTTLPAIHTAADGTAMPSTAVPQTTATSTHTGIVTVGCLCMMTGRVCCEHDTAAGWKHSTCSSSNVLQAMADDELLNMDFHELGDVSGLPLEVSYPCQLTLVS